MSKVRIAHVLVQPVVVIDNGEELLPGPELQTLQLPLSKVIEFANVLPGEVEKLQAKLDEEEGVVDAEVVEASK